MYKTPAGEWVDCHHRLVVDKVRTLAQPNRQSFVLFNRYMHVLIGEQTHTHTHSLFPSFGVSSSPSQKHAKSVHFGDKYFGFTRQYIAERSILKR